MSKDNVVSFDVRAADKERARELLERTKLLFAGFLRSSK